MDIFKHCPKCAGDLKQKNKACLACVKCGFEFYLNPKTANATTDFNANIWTPNFRRAGIIIY